MNASKPHKTDLIERSIYNEICRHDGILARDIAKNISLSRTVVNSYLYGAPFMKELCSVDDDYMWHGFIRQCRPHYGLEEFCAYYGSVSDFMLLSDEEWFERMLEGCRRISRNLNDTRGLFNSFRDCRKTMHELFRDMDSACSPDWEIAFELRINRARYIRIFADVLVITEDRVFSLEFKMKDKIDPNEVSQAAKYTEYLEILFGPGYDVIPALVLTRAFELYSYEPLGMTDAAIPVCSGDMLLNLFDEYLDFLQK